MLKFEFDEAELRRTLAILKPEGRLFEVRLIKGKKWNASGVFSDADILIDQLRTARLDPGANAYIVLNRMDAACYGRENHDRFVERMEPTTSDTDIVGYDWLMVDLDPVRPAGTSSTDEQIRRTKEVAGRICAYLKGRGWNDPVIAASGNGTHLLYSIKLNANKEGQELAHNCLKALNMLFADDEVDVDLKTANPARICKLYGTVARKGANTPDRPHRMSGILRVPERIAPTPVEYLRSLADQLPKQDTPQKYNGYNPGAFDLRAWITAHGVEVEKELSWQGGTKWLVTCPFNPAHKRGDAALIQGSDGKISYNCFHNSCAGNHWREFRLHYEPDAYSRQERPAVPNYMQTMPPDWGKPRAVEEQPSGPFFRTTEEIRARVVPEEAHIKTGITGIDSRIIGLKKGYVTVLSGLRSSGKSSILSQMVIQCRQQGLKCALFSGEMIDKQVLKWLTLQAASKAHVHGTQYAGVYYPNDDVTEPISRWLDGFVYVYNNDCGNRFTEIEARLRAIVAEKKLDLVLIDNLMVMDISDLDRDLYVRQKMFVLALKRMAGELNIHVVLVAHPRKSAGYLRIDDISGTGDLANVADNIFIIHRVDEDYKKGTQEFFRWKADNPLYSAGNVLEICKDRDFGTRDVYVPLYFEIETKRLKNTPAESIHYGWEGELPPEPAQSFVPVDDTDLPW